MHFKELNFGRSGVTEFAFKLHHDFLSIRLSIEEDMTLGSTDQTAGVHTQSYQRDVAQIMHTISNCQRRNLMLLAHTLAMSNHCNAHCGVLK